MRRCLDRVDREEKRAWGRVRIDPFAPTPPTRAAYRYYLDDPPRLLAGDRDGAREFLRKIEAVLAMYGWTDSECAKLRRMRKKWDCTRPLPLKEQDCQSWKSVPASAGFQHTRPATHSIAAAGRSVLPAACYRLLALVWSPGCGSA